MANLRQIDNLMNLSKKLLGILTLSIAGLSSPVLASDDYQGIYATGFVGANQVTDIDFGASGTLGFDTGLEVQVGLGYDFGRFRIEGMYGRSGSDFENTTTDSGFVDLISSTWVANVLVDFSYDSKFITSLGVGIGSTKHEITGFDDTVLNTDLIAGVAYKIADNSYLDMKYTYRIYDDITFGDIKISDESSQSLLAGLRFAF